MCFNTSHVKVYLTSRQRLKISIVSFNTSHVKVYHVKTCNIIGKSKRFNTSHVKVYLRFGNLLLTKL